MGGHAQGKVLVPPCIRHHAASGGTEVRRVLIGSVPGLSLPAGLTA